MLRVKNNLTQEQAGNLVGVSAETWSNWENAKTFPDIIKLQRIEKEFHIKYDEIIFLPQNTV